MTKHDTTSSGDSRQAGDEQITDLEITPAMIEAGVWEAREHQLGAPLDDLVRNVFIAMTIEASAR